MQLGSSSWSGEQQLKWMQSGSSSWRGCSWGAAVEGGAAAEVDVIREQQLKRMQPAEADATCWSGCSLGAVRPDHARLVLARDTTAQFKAHQSRGLCQTEAAPPTSAPGRAAGTYIGEWRAITGAGAIREQVHVASKRSERATCRGYYSCCIVLQLFYSLLHYKSGFWVLGWDYFQNWVGILSRWVGLSLRERVLENMPTPFFEQPLRFIAYFRETTVSDLAILH